MEDSSIPLPEFIQYRSIYNDNSGYFKHLLMYGNAHYHLLLEFNSAELDCLENTTLEMMYNAVKRNDDNALHDGWTSSPVSPSIAGISVFVQRRFQSFHY